MYKWHVNSALSRGRPLASDLSRTVDGIAATLRHFSISLSRTAAENQDGPHVTRSQRSVNAAREVSSLAASTPARGVDARSLAAKPPQGFTIRRVDEGGPIRDGSSARGRGGFSGQRGSVPGTRGGLGMSGRGGRGGRGAARGRKRGRATGRGGPAPGQDEDEVNHGEWPLDSEEQAWFDGFEGGFEIPYNPTTSLEYLKRQGASAMPPSSPMGVVESVVHKVQVATNMVSAPNTHAAVHLERMSMGRGSSFESREAKAVTQAYYDQLRQAHADSRADSEGTERKKIRSRILRTFDTVPEDVRSTVAKAWVAGHYIGPKPAKKGDILGQVEAYARLNETYLPNDMRRFEEKLRSLLPSAFRRPELEEAQQPNKVQGQL